MRFRPFSASILAIGLAALTGCGGYGLQFTNSTPTTGTIRFINGAPSAASLDFLLSASAGNENQIAYGTISQTLTIGPGTYTITASVTGTSTVFATQTAFVVAVGQHYTLVATGTAAAPKFVAFTEPIFETLVNSAAVNYHDASAQSGTVAIPVGIFDGTKTTQLGTITPGSQTGAIPLSLPVDPTTGLPTVNPNTDQSSINIVFFAFAPARAPFSSHQADATDTLDLIPFGGDHNLQLYLIDTPAGSPQPGQLIGIFDFDA